MGGDPQRPDYWIRHHPYDTLAAEPGETARADADDARIVERVTKAYRRSMQGDYYGADSMWKTIRDERQGGLHELLARGRTEDIAAALRSPKDNFLLHGFETLTRDVCRRFESNPNLRKGRAERLHDLLARLAEALGALRVENPEGGPWLENVKRTPDALLDLVEGKLGIPLAVPWFWAGLVGLKTSRGVFGHRMLHAAYGAHRIRQLAARSVLEIGAGLGHLARYAWLMGIRDYTIADLPLTNVAQGYFLMRTLGEEAVVLEGEPLRARAIRVLTPQALAAETRYDLVVNVDSLTEMGRETASAYLEKIFRVTECLLSINHEANPFTVNELARQSSRALAIERYPYWLRNGYVEEIVRRA